MNHAGWQWSEWLRFFLFTCAAGGGIFVYRQVQSKVLREKEHRQDVLDKRMVIVGAFHDIKKARRMMRTVTSTDEAGFRISSPDAWLNLVSSLNEHHLQIEKLRRQSFSEVTDLPFNSDVMGQHLKTIDEYVRRVLSEIEASNAFSSNRIEYESVPVLADFLFGTSPPEYTPCFRGSRPNNERNIARPQGANRCANDRLRAAISFELVHRTRFDDAARLPSPLMLFHHPTFAPQNDV